MATFKRTVPGLLPTSRYIVKVRAVSGLGIKSDWAEAAVVKSPADSTIPATPADLVLDFSTPDLNISWTPLLQNADGSVLNDLSHYKVTLNGTESYETFSPSFTYTLAQNRAKRIPPEHTFNVDVVAVDKFYQESVPLAGTVSHQELSQPPAPVLIPSFNNIRISMRPHNDDVGNVVRYKLEHSEDGVAWTLLGTSINGEYTHEVEQGSENHYRYWAEDFFDRASPTSEEQSKLTEEFPTQSDGQAPEFSPIPKVTGGPGFLFAQWDAVPNADLVTYEVHLGTSALFAPSESTKVTEGVITSAFIKNLPDGNPLSYGTWYYVKTIAKDEDDPAAPSLASISAQMTKITTVHIGDEQILAPQIAANTIVAGSAIIATGAIGSAQINSLSADKITAGTISAAISMSSPTINGGTITGALLQTANNGFSRIVLNDAGTASTYISWKQPASPPWPSDLQFAYIVGNPNGELTFGSQNTGTGFRWYHSGSSVATLSTSGMTVNGSSVLTNNTHDTSTGGGHWYVHHNHAGQTLITYENFQGYLDSTYLNSGADCYAANGTQSRMVYYSNPNGNDGSNSSYARSDHQHGHTGFASSTRAVKDSIEEIEFDALSEIAALQPVLYKYKDNEELGMAKDEDDWPKRFGVILEDSTPLLKDPRIKGNMDLMAYSTLNARAIQQLLERVEQLEAKIAELEQ